MEEKFAEQVVKIWRLRQRAERLRLRAPMSSPEPGVLSAGESCAFRLYQSVVKQLRAQCLALAEGD